MRNKEGTFVEKGRGFGMGWTGGVEGKTVKMCPVCAAIPCDECIPVYLSHTPAEGWGSPWARRPCTDTCKPPDKGIFSL